MLYGYEMVASFEFGGLVVLFIIMTAHFVWADSRITRLTIEVRKLREVIRRKNTRINELKKENANLRTDIELMINK